MSGPKPEGAGISLLIAIRDHALSEAEDREREATTLEARAAGLRWEAKGLRETFTTASPYFPADPKGGR